jgi:hypothetical protein
MARLALLAGLLFATAPTSALKPAAQASIRACLQFEPGAARLTGESAKTIETLLQFVDQKPAGKVSHMEVGQPLDHDGSAATRPTPELALQRQQAIVVALFGKPQVNPLPMTNNPYIQFSLYRRGPRGAYEPPREACDASLWLRYEPGQPPAACKSDDCFVACKSVGCAQWN